MIPIKTKQSMFICFTNQFALCTSWRMSWYHEELFHMFPSGNTTLDRTLAEQFIFNIDGYHSSRNEVGSYSVNQPVVLDSTRPQFSKFLKVCLQHMDHRALESTCGDWLHKTRAFRSCWTCYHLAFLFWGELFSVVILIYTKMASTSVLKAKTPVFLVTKKLIAG